VRSAPTSARRPIALASVAAAILSLVLLPGGGAAAAPSPADTEKQLAALGVKMDKINEAGNSARVQLKRVQTQKAGLDRQMGASQATLDESRAAVGRIAASAYRDGGMRMSAAILEGSPGQFLDQMATLEWLSSAQKATLAAAKTQQTQFDQAKTKVDLQVQSATRLQKQLDSQRTQLSKELTKWQQIKRTLAVKQNSTGGGTNNGGSSSDSGSTHVTYSGPASGNAASVVRFALAQQGEPYVFGAAGPHSWDCSGLTEMAWAQVGVSLPHSSSQQYAQIRHVSKADIEPGDLIFFYDFSHVGVYIGNNQVVHAPTEGESVKVTNISYMPYAGAGRP
jgi:cell wall-associated NlpC family hydrolase